MFFRDLVESTEQWEQYETVLSDLSLFVDESVRLLVSAFDVVQTASFPEQCYSHATVLMLTRHVIEAIDGVSVLARQGCAENCGPLLRSAFEGQLGLLYILETDSKRRALAYQVAHAHRQIKMYRRCDSQDPLGKQMRAELTDDPMADVFDRVPTNLSAAIANLESMFTKPDFLPIETEWRATRKKKDPEWFALFGGPRDVRSLSIHLKLGAAYEGLYRTWSDVIHAGSGLKHVGPSGRPGVILIRPIRHPDGLETACCLAVEICVNTVRHLLGKYDLVELGIFQQVYSERIGPRCRELSQRKLIHAPWK